MTEQLPVYKTEPVELDAETAERLARELYDSVRATLDGGMYALYCAKVVIDAAQNMDRDAMAAACVKLARHIKAQHTFANSLQKMNYFIDLMMQDNADNGTEKT